MTQTIERGILTDTSKAIQAAYWLSEFSSDSRELYGDTDLFHLFWWLYINWDPSSEDLKISFPIENVVTRAKDINVGDSINQALGLGLNFDEPMWEQAKEPGNISNLVNGLKTQFPDMDKDDCDNLEAYILTRMSGNQPEPALLESVEAIKQTINQTVKLASEAHSPKP